MAKTIPAGLADIADRISSTKFDLDIYRQAGVFVIRGLIPPAIMAGWQQEWRDFQASKLQDRKVNKANPVDLAEALPGGLATLYKEPLLIALMQQIYGENVGLFGHRFVIKDKFSRDKVFLHQDSCYQIGTLNKCSLFVPLSVADKDNGAMMFHLGSHRLGFLGDAGEIDLDAFDMQWPVATPALEPGDVAVMDSHVWHASWPNTNGVDRILAQITVQPADDPSSLELVSGSWQTDVFFPGRDITRFFRNSRVRRNIAYEKERAERAAALAESGKA